MDYVKKNHQIANSFYNLGLEKAFMRDLTGAAACLKKSLHFNKYHTDARNLLGLVYYEVGEVSDAIVQWVISLNMQPEKNRCDYYLDEIQRKAGRLEIVSQNVKKYNQALWYAKNDSDDLAVIQLTKVIASNHNFVKAHLLLALLYLTHDDFTKAGKSLLRVLQIDKNNPKALSYMTVVKANTGRLESEKKKLKNAFSHRQMQDDDIIIPPTYKENAGWQTIANIVIGLFLGAAVIYFLIMPANTKAINNRHNQEMIEYNQKLSDKNLEIDRLNNQLELAESEKTAVQDSYEALLSDSGGVVSQYQILVQILEAYKKDDFTKAVTLYATLNTALITDETMQSMIGEIKTEMDAKGYQVLEELGNRAAEAGDSNTALDYYQKSLNIKPDNPQVIFEMAMVYKKSGDTDQSNQLFGEVIMNYSNLELAAKAKAERGY